MEQDLTVFTIKILILVILAFAIVSSTFYVTNGSQVGYLFRTVRVNALNFMT